MRHSGLIHENQVHKNLESKPNTTIILTLLIVKY